MRSSILFALSIVAATTVLNTSTKAQNYPWCAYYGSKEGGGTNCGFTTFQQCLDTVSGIGGFCNWNTQYVPPPGPHPSRKVLRHDPY